MTGGKRSRNKGAGGELEFASVVRPHGFACERTGRNGRTAEDVTHSIPGFHIEVKRQERLDIPAWLRQAHGDAGALIPLVAFRRNKTRAAVDPLGEWHALLPLAALLGLLRELEDLRAEVKRLRPPPEGLRQPPDRCHYDDPLASLPRPGYCDCDYCKARAAA